MQDVFTKALYKHEWYVISWHNRKYGGVLAPARETITNSSKVDALLLDITGR